LQIFCRKGRLSRETRSRLTSWTRQSYSGQSDWFCYHNDPDPTEDPEMKTLEQQVQELADREEIKEL